MKTKCLIVDDEPLARDALATLAGKIPELEIAGQCQDAVEALQFLRGGNIDLVFLDIQMPELKPISLERLLRAVNRYHDRMKTNPAGTVSRESNTGGIVKIYSDKKTHKTHTSEILFVEGLKDYALVHTEKGRLITRQTMKNLERLLAPYDFVRVHRSWIVPFGRISSWTNHSVTAGDKDIPIGKTYRKTVLDYLENKGQ